LEEKSKGRCQQVGKIGSPDYQGVPGGTRGDGEYQKTGVKGKCHRERIVVDFLLTGASRTGGGLTSTMVRGVRGSKTRVQGVEKQRGSLFAKGLQQKSHQSTGGQSFSGLLTRKRGRVVGPFIRDQAIAEGEGKETV